MIVAEIRFCLLFAKSSYQHYFAILLDFESMKDNKREGIQNEMKISTLK